jgi:Zn-dependent M28 family amino/carboxypeptidase
LNSLSLILEPRGVILFKRNNQKKDIIRNSKEIVHYLSVNLGERTLREYHNLQAARTYIIEKFRKQGGEVHEDTYTIDGKEVSSIIVDIPGYENPEEIILLSGHYDTVEDTPGADDNATSIAALLEIHRMMSPFKFKKTMRFAAFTLEEPPFFKTDDMGSMRYAAKCKKKKEKIQFMAAIDMIGFACKKCRQKLPTGFKIEKYPPFGDFLAVISLPSMSEYVHLWKKIYNSHAKHKVYDFVAPASVPGMDLSDHSSFIQKGFPGILLTDTAFYRSDNYHQPTDIYETINFIFLGENICNIMTTLKEMCNYSQPFIKE